MELVIVERVFDEPVEIEALAATEEQFSWCREQYRVTYLRSYFSKDKKRMLCLYEAPDAESVRELQRTAGMPVERIWAATQFDA